jgi:hypothetical protein
LREQVIERPRMPFAELIQRPMIRLQIPRQKAEPQIFRDALFQSPRTGDALRVAIQPHLQQQLRRISGPALLGVFGFELTEIQPLDRFVQEKDDVVLIQFVFNAGRKQPSLVRVVGSKSAHVCWS